MGEQPRSTRPRRPVCEPTFELGDYETACFAAMKAVEVAVRDASGLDNSLVGVKLMRTAFQPHQGGKAGGPLAARRRREESSRPPLRCSPAPRVRTRIPRVIGLSTSTTPSRLPRSSSSPTC
ncbi:TIGR02391 family protein [Streptomyces sp. NPDC093509]|uniref:TIGR02391 family protein n=1 Tax=Streptomyces sp. NPDC093509 TaxID=3154982 RepID=UPI00344FBE6B